ncbi:MAG: hypothetical protein JW938_04520, partial [Candidatus Omnitrophica bacterium]|nr:hypothetical protein [Candidatus Omnitrophota bacterium]
MTSMVSGVFAQDNKIYDTVPCTRATLSNWFSTAQIEEHSTVITAGFAGHPSFMNANWAMIKRDVQPAKMISGKKVTNLEHIRFNIVMQSTTITITVDGQERLLLIETEMLDELRARKVDIEDALAFAINHDKNKDEILYGLRTGNMAFGWLDESPSLFLDHVKNKFVGVHKKLFAAGLTNVELGLVLALGFVHEMRHEVSGNIKKTGDYKDPNDEGVQFRKDEVLWKHMTEGMATITSTRDQDLVRFMKYVIGEIAYDEIKRKKIIPSATKAVDYKTVDDLIERINKVRRLRLLEEKARHLVIKIGTIDDLKEILDDVSDMIEIAQQNIKALSTLIENEAKHERHSNLNGILPLIRLVLSEAEPDMYLRGIS